MWDEPILQKEPDAKRLATVAVCARLFSQLRDRVARQLDDDQLWLWDGVRAASVETQAPPPFSDASVATTIASGIARKSAQRIGRSMQARTRHAGTHTIQSGKQG